MLGNRMLNKAIVKVSEEGAKQQHELVCNEIDKLCELTNHRWDLISGTLFDKVRKVSFGQGFVAGMALTGLVTAGCKIVKKRKPKTDEEE